MVKDSGSHAAAGEGWLIDPQIMIGNRFFRVTAYPVTPQSGSGDVG
jgi:hypothetical protein